MLRQSGPLPPPGLQSQAGGGWCSGLPRDAVAFVFMAPCSFLIDPHVTAEVAALLPVGPLGASGTRCRFLATLEAMNIFYFAHLMLRCRSPGSPLEHPRTLHTPLFSTGHHCLCRSPISSWCTRWSPFSTLRLLEEPGGASVSRDQAISCPHSLPLSPLPDPS